MSNINNTIENTPQSPTAEIIAIGTELLLGHTINTDATIIAQELASVGINIYFMQTVGDNAERLTTALETALKRSHIVITTGGLGPTPDDLSKNIVAKVCKQPLTINATALETLKTRYASIKLEPNQIQQAYFPANAHILANALGTAPGCAVPCGQNQWVCMLPGPPNELEPMLKQSLLPLLQEHFPTGILATSKLRVFGLSEANIAQTLGDLTTHANPTVATYAGNGEIMVRLTAHAATFEQANELLTPYKEQILSLLGSYLYGIDVDSLEVLVVAELRHRHLTLALAESCTGGLLAKRITDQSGASDIFGFGFVTYANEAKIELLGVQDATLAAHGAVSAETAQAMAQGARARGHADLALAITGIAGPLGGTHEKPVGLVYISLACAHTTFTRCLKPHPYFRTRSSIRQRSANHALDMLRRYLFNLPVEDTWAITQS